MRVNNIIIMLFTNYKNVIKNNMLILNNDKYQFDSLRLMYTPECIHQLFFIY